MHIHVIKHNIALNYNWRLTDIGGLPGSDVAVCMVGAVNINGEECVGREVETAVTCEGIGDTAKLGEENTVFKLVCRGVV